MTAGEIAGVIGAAVGTVVVVGFAVAFVGLLRTLRTLVGAVEALRAEVVPLAGQWRRTVDQANADNQARTAPQSVAEIRSRAASAHQALLAAIRSLSDADWNAPATYDSPSMASLGEMLGSVLGAPDYPFGHTYAHLDDLRSYIRSRSEPTG